MNRVFTVLLFACILSITAMSCKKGSGNYINMDHTTGMAGARNWTGTTWGYSSGDTVVGTDTVSPWPKWYSRTLSDTPANVIKVNGYAVNVFDIQLPYRSTDSTAQTVRFDSTIGNALPTILIYYYAKDSMTFEYHANHAWNTDKGVYYQENLQMHTKGHL